MQNGDSYNTFTDMKQHKMFLQLTSSETSANNNLHLDKRTGLILVKW